MEFIVRVGVGLVMLLLYAVWLRFFFAVVGTSSDCTLVYRLLIYVGGVFCVRCEGRGVPDV